MDSKTNTTNSEIEESKDSVAKEQIDLVKEEKIKKNLLWFGIFSIIMLFAGITSGYIVAKDTSFWVNIKLPNFFLYSSIIVVVSSILLYFSSKYIIKNNTKMASVLIGLALLLGSFFGISQYEGFMKMAENGNALRAKILNLEGRYGEYFSLYKDTKEITFDGETYFWQGEKISDEMHAEIKIFLSQFLEVRVKEVGQIQDYGKYILQYKGTPLTYLNNRLESGNLSLSPTQKSRLYHFSEAVINNRGDFYMIGKYGEDFSINYKGKPVQYENRKFYRDQVEISPYAFSELTNSSNRASSFVLAFIVIHALHWLAGIIVLLVLFINTIKNKYSSTNYIGLKIGSIYWHFLGIIWLYLYVFLNFIH